jgi:uncharacterized protein (TIGR02594 family)
MSQTEIKAWQQLIGVDPDGDFGPVTLAASTVIYERSLQDAGLPSGQPVPAANKTPWMDVAKKELGQHEVQGGENPRILEYLRSTYIGAPGNQEDETPWCSAFVNWCLQQVGIKGTRSAWARSFETYGKKMTGPEVGCIVVFDWHDGTGHVGFVTGWTGTTVTVLGGNQADSVSLATFSRRNVSALVWPL